MTRRRYSQMPIFATVLVCTLVQIGCTTEEELSSTPGGYTFSRDFDGERRVLRIEPSYEVAAACMETSLPAETNAHWKDASLAPERHRALIELLFDETRLPSYQADLDAVAANGTFICSPRPSEPDFCYMPQVVVTGEVPHVKVKIDGISPPRYVRSPLRFGLQPKVALSDEGRELIDAFLIAHEACWNADD